MSDSNRSEVIRRIYASTNNDELREMCQTISLNYQPKSPEKLVADFALRLLAQCDAMREWLHNARNQAAHDALPGLIIAIDNMLLRLGERT